MTAFSPRYLWGIGAGDDEESQGRRGKTTAAHSVLFRPCSTMSVEREFCWLLKEGEGLPFLPVAAVFLGCCLQAFSGFPPEEDKTRCWEASALTVLTAPDTAQSSSTVNTTLRTRNSTTVVSVNHLSTAPDVWKDELSSC